jgi:hypothetical protein
MTGIYLLLQTRFSSWIWLKKCIFSGKCTPYQGQSDGKMELFHSLKGDQSKTRKRLFDCSFQTLYTGRTMSIIQDLYKIFDNERSRYETKMSSRNAVLRELAENLAFLREGLREGLDGSEIIKGLESLQYERANDAGFDFNAIKKSTLSPATYGSVKEFEKYRGWSTEKLIRKAYERLSTLQKLQANAPGVDFHSRLQYLFKFLMVVMAHIDGKHLTIRSRRNTSRAAGSPV